MSSRSLEDVLQTRSAVDLARNSQIGPYVYPGYASEFTNWRDEQQAWRTTSCLFDQSYHMTDLYIKGPDALRLLSDLAINSFENFAVNKAKQFVACNYDGYVIGDAILFYLDDDLLSLVGRPSAHNWVQYHCETGRLRRDHRARRARGRQSRQPPALPLPGAGPDRAQVLEKANGGPLPEIKFFNMGVITVGGPQGAGAAPRHVRRSRPGAVRPVGRGQGGQGGPPRGRPGVRAAARGLPRLRDQHARVGLDPLPAARDLHGRQDEGVPRVAAGRLVRGHRLARRQLLLRRHLGLLHDALRPRLRRLRPLRPRLHRPRRRAEDVGEPEAAEGDARLARRGRRGRHGDDVPQGR